MRIAILFSTSCDCVMVVHWPLRSLSLLNNDRLYEYTQFINSIHVCLWGAIMNNAAMYIIELVFQCTYTHVSVAFTPGRRFAASKCAQLFNLVDIPSGFPSNCDDLQSHQQLLNIFVNTWRQCFHFCSSNGYIVAVPWDFNLHVLNNWWI